jgi:hypothetical protein
MRDLASGEHLKRLLSLQSEAEYLEIHARVAFEMAYA